MSSSMKFRLIHLSRCRGMTRGRLRKLLQLSPSLDNVTLLTPSQFKQYLAINETQAENLYQDLHNQKLIQTIQEDLSNYPIITIIDENYPSMLKTIKDAPLVLYASGNVSLLNQSPSLSVIGTRKPSNMALPKINYIIPPLIKQNWVIVSGMAKGIDSFAHRLSLYHHGKTIAVLGSGFHHIYPKENQTLFHQIEKNGLVISEYAPNMPAKPYHFPERNRIISGLSFGTLVIEATKRSGTLITVDQALDQGRQVYAVPGSPHMPQSTGCLELILDGASMVQSYEDILMDWEMQGDNWDITMRQV